MVKVVEFDRSWIGSTGYVDSVPNLGHPVAWVDHLGRKGLSVPAGEGCVTVHDKHPARHQMEGVVATGEARGIILAISSGNHEARALLQRVVELGKISVQEATILVEKYISKTYPKYENVSSYYQQLVETQLSFLREWGWLIEEGE